MRIFLIGYMLCGKSTIGKKLANKLSCDFIDTDTYIEDKYHYTISDIFNKFSEEVFRDMEKETLKEIIEREDIVVATGGGLVCYNDNMKLIKETSTSIYLKMNSEALFSRYVQSKKPRPLFSHMDNEQVKQYIENTLRKREGYYEQADITIDALSCKVDDIMLKINH